MHRPTKKQYIQSVKVISLLVITLLFCISQKGYSKPKVNSRLLVKSLLQDTLKQQQDTTLSIKDSSILVLDSTLSAISKDTLVRPDSISLAKLIELTIQDEYEMVEELYDSLMVASNYKLVPLDSLNLQKLAFPPRILTPKEIKLLEKEKKWAYRDSVIRNTPRLLETYFFPDSTIYRRMFMWQAGSYFNTPKEIKPDTTFNTNYTEMPAERNDVGATTLGVAGSAMQYYDYFKREELDVFPFFSPYLPYTYTPETMPFYNVKTPYTELAYWGTLFANKQKEETNIKFLHTQNVLPALNFAILYQRFGGNGILQNEKTDNRTFALTGNYLGKRYVAQGGYIFSGVKRNDNGGIVDPSMVLDTTIDARIIPVALQDAKTHLKKNTFFINHSYGIPFKFLQRRDSLGNRDSIGLGEGTMAYIGHYGEYSTYTKSYKDNIALTDTTGRDFYNNHFYINPTTSADSSRVMRLENRVYIRLQPWSKEGIISKLDAGVGYQYLSIYNFKPDYFLQGNKNTSQSNLYLYFGAQGQFKKYFSWDGFGKYHFAGYGINDYQIDGKIKFSAYPIDGGIHLNAGVHISGKKPNFFYENYVSNHYIWDNNFDKTTTTKIEGRFTIPKYKFEIFFGYALLNNNVYFNEEALPTQNKDAMSIMTAYLKKDFKVWKFHMNNQVLFQLSSKDEVVPLPKVALNLRYYFQFNLVKEVLDVQLGVNATFNTKYYAPAYSPALGLFHNQTQEKIGNNPYLDAFINLQWKRASIFVKYINAAQGWPTSDYFSAYRYLRPQTALKFGIHWPFYIR